MPSHPLKVVGIDDWVWRRNHGRGFSHMIRQGAIDGFSDQKDAEEASEAIRLLERHRPKAQIDPSDPYGLAFNRATMIWERFPTQTV